MERSIEAHGHSLQRICVFGVGTSVVPVVSINWSVVPVLGVEYLEGVPRLRRLSLLVSCAGFGGRILFGVGTSVVDNIIKKCTYKCTSTHAAVRKKRGPRFNRGS